MSDAIKTDAAATEGCAAVTGSAATEKRSPADICLKRVNTVLDFDPNGVFQIEDYLHQLPITLEIRAWVCPWCGTSTEYVVLNDACILGCGMATMMSGGKTSDCCGDWRCVQKQEEWHRLPSVQDHKSR